MTGAELKGLLKERGWKQKDFAEHLDMTERQVSRWYGWDKVPTYAETIAYSLPYRLTSRYWAS